MKWFVNFMQSPIRVFCLISASIGFITACQDDEEIVEEPTEIGYPGVDEDLWIYFSRFEEEALSRGISADLRAATIEGVIDELEEHRVLGECSYSFRQPNLLTIDETFWNQSSDRAKEFVVFHELGHCFLNRAHREDTDTRGLCLSIMRSGTGSCRDNYNQLTRSQYLNELFDVQYAGDIFE